jgi:hypothetical protein
MYMNLTKPLLLSLFTFILSGCLTGNVKQQEQVSYQYNPEHSLALNFMLASGAMVDDGEIKDAEIDKPESASSEALDFQQAQVTRSLAVDAISLHDGISTLAGLRPPPAGVSSGFHGGMMLLSLFANKPRKPIFLRSHFVAFMPKDMARNQVEAAEVLREMLKVAALKALPDDAEVNHVVNEWKGLIGKGRKEHDVVTGGGCNNSYVMFHGKEDGPVGCKMVIDVLGEPGITKSPSWLGGEDAYFFHPEKYKRKGPGEGLIIARLDVSEKPNTGWPDLDKRDEIITGLGEYSPEKFALRISEHMPNWFYVYIAPTKNDPVPKILYQGEEYYFVKWKNESDNNITRKL